MAVDLAKLKPGLSITCTVSKRPRTEDQEVTIERLMRQDASAKKGLKRAQRLRRQRVIVYNRGNRDWTKREKTARVVRVEVGATWSMPFTLDKAADLKAVEKFVSVKAG